MCSPDGNTLATAVARGQLAETPEKDVKIALFDLGSPSQPRMLDASHYSGGLQFTPDGKSAVYVTQGERGGQHMGAATGRFCGPSGYRLQVGANLVISPVARWKEPGHSARSL